MIRLGRHIGLDALPARPDPAPRLQRLALAYNSIGPMGGAAIGEAFARNRSLTELDLGGNLIGHKGGRAIAQALQANPSLTHVVLRGNSLDATTKLLLGDVKAEGVRVDL